MPLILIVLALAAGCPKSPGESATPPASPSPGVVAPPERPTASAVPPLPRLHGPHHPVFDFTANRLLAHIERDGGLTVWAGHPGLAKYVTFGRPRLPWQLGQRLDDRPVALALQKTAWLQLPLTTDQARARTLTLALHGFAEQQLTVAVNDRALPAVELARGWQQLRIDLPEGALRAGENRVELAFAAAGRRPGTSAFAALAWLHLGGALPADTQDPLLLRSGRLWLPAGGGLTYLVHPYAGAKLDLAYRAEGDCELATTLSPEGHPEAMSPRPAPAGRLVETFVELAPLAGRVGRLSLAARGEGCQGIALQRAAIVMPGPAPAVRRPAKPRNVLFWMIDNARADRYKAYNPKTRVTTPVIDGLARSGTVFERAYIVGTESRVSHAALWTGLFPRQHRFISAKAVLDPRWVTLPEALRGAGLRTAAWIANGWISERWGFAEGWDVFHNTLHEGRGLSAGALADHAIRFLNKRGAEQPFFLYLGTIDVHVSWRGKQPWLDRYDPEPYRGKYEKNVWGKDVDKMASGKITVSERDRRRIIAMYDSNVSYNDEQLGRVLQALEAIGQREQTMVLITADHGEELWDFGHIGHGHVLREPLIAVPLIVHYPPLFGSGVRVAEGVDVLAAMATMLDAVGAPVPEAVQGASLLPLAQGVGRGYPRPALATLYDRAYALRLEEHKVRMDSKGRARTFDLAGPGGETEAVDAQQPLAARWLTDVLSTFLVYQDRWRQARWGVASNHLSALPTDLEQGTGPAPITPKGDGLKK